MKTPRIHVLNFGFATNYHCCDHAHISSSSPDAIHARKTSSTGEWAQRHEFPRFATHHVICMVRAAKISETCRQAVWIQLNYSVLRVVPRPRCLCPLHRAASFANMTAA